jgi:biopolymer transport protein TolR
MALSAHDAFAASGGGRGRRRRGRARRGALSEINVTPLVDVMLVLLIVFMISAPLLTAGVPVELPKTEAGSLQDQTEPLTVTIRANGQIFIKEDEVPFGKLAPRLSTSGFSSINLITDTGGPSSGAAPKPPAISGGRAAP